jgi:dihydrodipicolinate synthase/N-acetylneuraminate lyase
LALLFGEAAVFLEFVVSLAGTGVCPGTGSIAPHKRQETVKTIE